MPTRDRLLRRYDIGHRTFTRWCRNAGIDEKEIPRGRKIASDRIFQLLEEIWIATRVCHLDVELCLEKFSKGYTLKKLIKERHPKRTLLEHLTLAIKAHPDPEIENNPVVVHQLELLKAKTHESEPDIEPEPEIPSTGAGGSYEPSASVSQGSVDWSRRISNIL